MEDLQVACAWAREHQDVPGLEWAPIRAGIEPPAAWIVRSWQAVGLAGLFLGLILLHERTSLWESRAVIGPENGARTVAITLDPPPPSPRIAPGPATSGTGHVRGSDSIDPALKRLALQHRLPNAPFGPDSQEGELSRLVEGGREVEGLDFSLPEAAGGSGAARGYGHDATRGGFKAERVPTPSRFDYRLVPMFMPSVQSTGPFTEEERTIPVVVELAIGEDGLPTSARAISGPARFRPIAEATARRWRFEPLGLHGLSAPMRVTIRFLPHELVRSRM